MSNTWNKFLTKHWPPSLSLPTEKVEAKPSILPLTNMGILEVKGADSTTFLQNLFTNDVNTLQVNQSQLSGFCNAKGRLFSLFLLIKRENSYQLILPVEMCGPLVQRLGLYILRSDVQINDISQDSVLLGLIHPNTFNNDDNHTKSLYIQHPADDKRAILIATTDDAVKVCGDLLEQKWQLTPESFWQLLDIEAGLPMIFPETKESFTPQQVNLDLLGGVSFSKGCYPGQEVVARLHYLGTPSRRLFFAKAESRESPIAGSEVLLEDASTAGHIVVSQRSDSETTELLVSLKTVNYDKPLFLDNNAHLNSLINLSNVLS